MTKILYHILLLASALLLACSCQHHKSAEEGERFLQETAQKIFNKSDSTVYLQQQLFEAEQHYDFTPEQRIRLKTSLFEYLTTNDSLLEKQITEAEALAIRLNNDSIRKNVQWLAFRSYIQLNDVEKAHRFFRRHEAALLADNDSVLLNRYYLSLAILYNRVGQPDSAFYWQLKTRSMSQPQLTLWYGQASEYLFHAGRHDEALLYADSSLNYRPTVNTAKHFAYQVKGFLLAFRGRIPEALSLYAEALGEIEAFRKKVKALPKAKALPAIGYNPASQLIIYQYAELLHQTGRTPEAIALLEKIVINTKLREQLLKEGIDSYTMRYKRGDHYFPQFLLASCYHSLGQTEKAIRYTQIGDSLQSAYTAHMRQKQIEAEKTQSSNQYLTTHLLVREQEVKNARLMQYLLWGTVAFLLAVIATGLVWWRERRRRLRQLFGQLVRRHTDWLEIHALLPHPAALAEGCVAAGANKIEEADFTDLPTDDENLRLINRQLYHRVLHVMEQQRPFLDPQLDLVALARIVGTNRTKLSIVINQEGDNTFSNWLAEYRVNYLLSELDRQPKHLIDELYPSAGFSSRTSFYRQFRHVTGLTPKQYMKERNEKA